MNVIASYTAVKLPDTANCLLMKFLGSLDHAQKSGSRFFSNVISNDLKHTGSAASNQARLAATLNAECLASNG